jgi:hypothetical protein
MIRNKFNLSRATALSLLAFSALLPHDVFGMEDDDHDQKKLEKSFVKQASTSFKTEASEPSSNTESQKLSSQPSNKYVKGEEEVEKAFIQFLDDQAMPLSSLFLSKADMIQDLLESFNDFHPQFPSEQKREKVEIELNNEQVFNSCAAVVGIEKEGSPKYDKIYYHL